MQVDIDQNKLQAYGLSAEDVVNAIGRQNIVTPVGTEKVGDFEYVVALNGSPTRLDELNDMPIRVVNGATVFVRDVAYAHFGAPPQINMVRVDGTNAVLMTILKTGSASTLDVINGVKALLPKLRETLPESLKLDTINDQSSFVYAAVNSVIFEGVVAAALTGLMILIFLGSWRSTLIITISIPLAILASVAALSAIGETINVMTLGGLALAVGILVDDATVTIENINWHLEQGKDIESAIMDGARQIVLPATVSLLCICIVFVPMFSLGGVAGLSIPADGRSGRLRARRVLRAVAHTGQHDGALSARRSGAPRARNCRCGRRAIRWCSSSVASSAGSRRRAPSIAACLETALAARWQIHCRLSRRRRLLRSRSRRISGRTSFRRSPTLSSSFTCARRPERASKTPRRSATASKAAIRRIIPARRARSDRRQHRSAGQRHQFRLTTIPAPSVRPTPIS